MSDKKIDTKSKDIAYFNSRNAAIEICKMAKNIKDLDKLTISLYNDWVKWRNETDMRSELKKCPECGASLTRKTGKSKKSGKPYDFYSCSNYPNCKYTEDTDETILKAKIEDAKEQQVIDLAKEEAIKRSEQTN